MDLGLKDQVVFITGASRGIGRSTAELLLDEGCRVAITGRTEETLARAVQELGGEERVLAIQGDMTKNEDIERAVAQTIERFGRIDVLVTCAGSSPGGLLENLTEEEWMGSLNLKFMGYVRSCRAVIPHMVERGGGAIVLVVGNDGLKPSYWEMTAGAANAADHNFASSLAEQYGPKGIRVNTVNPGPVDTDRWDGLEKAFARDKGCDQQTAHDLAVSSIPLGRICTPEEVANLVAFVASPRASFLNGAHIPIDGGQRKALMDIPLAAREGVGAAGD
jgi:3-oxoacyl-[acyl-carrier protein] reductase